MPNSQFRIAPFLPLNRFVDYHVYMNMMRMLILAAVAVVGLLLAGGCAGPPPAGVSDPIIVEADADALFAAATRTLRNNRFVIFHEDPKIGEVVTEPLTGQQMWEFWRTDSIGLYNQLESSAHTIERTVKVRIYPVRDAAGNQVPGRQHLELRVFTERMSVEERELTAVNQVPTLYSGLGGTPASVGRSNQDTKQPAAHPVYLGRDGRLEDWLIRDILRRVSRTPAMSARTAPDEE